jgi:E3 ubiquitin-protein ligase HUWE1
VTLHIRITLLSDVFATAGYAHGRAAIGLLQTFMSNTTPEVVKDLGSLHRATIWENIVLKAGLISKGIDIAATPSSSPLEATPEQTTIPLPDPDATAMISSNGVQQEAAPNPTPFSEDSKPDSHRQHNATALKHLTHGLPSSLAPFFQGERVIYSLRVLLRVAAAMVKMFHARRNPDAAQKKQITESSSVIAEIMVKHLSPRAFGEPYTTPELCTLLTYESRRQALLVRLLHDHAGANHDTADRW